MTSIKKMMFVGISLFLAVGSLSQTSLASEPDDGNPTPQEIDAVLISPLKATNLAIQNDIDVTRNNIKKMSDVTLQGDAIRNLLLRTMGHISSYTIAECNAFFFFFKNSENLIPYALITQDQNNPPAVDLEIPWFEDMKDPKKVLVFNDPISLINLIKANFTVMAQRSLDVATSTKEAILDSPSEKIAPPKEATGFGPNVIKYILHRRHLPQSSI